MVLASSFPLTTREVLSSDEHSPKRARKGKTDISHLLEGPPPETEEEIAARKARWHKTVR